MQTESLVLQGKHIRLEPLDRRHADALVAASAADPSLYQWSAVPLGKIEVTRYIDTALAWRNAASIRSRRTWSLPGPAPGRKRWSQSCAAFKFAVRAVPRTMSL